MRAMILAAGLGKRMHPLTANKPKPLLKVGDKTLIEYQIERLVQGGITGVVINHFYLGTMIEEALGDGSQFDIDESRKVHEDHEARDKRLTFSGISVMHKMLFEGFPIQPRSTIPLLQEAMANDLVSGEVHDGLWIDVGTPERLHEVNAIVAKSNGN